VAWVKKQFETILKVNSKIKTESEQAAAYSRQCSDALTFIANDFACLLNKIGEA